VSDEILLWQPSEARVADAQITGFRERFAAKLGRALPDYAALHAASIDEPEAFWECVWDATGVGGEKGAPPFLVDRDAMPGARFFPNARLNFAENLLRRRDDSPALLFCNEAGTRRTLGFADLYEQVARWRSALQAAGLEPGDRVAAYMPNVPETIVAMLATTSLGGVFSSCSPDFGVRGVVDRFGQIEPKLLVAIDGYVYGGKRFDVSERLPEILAGLPSVETSVLVPYPSDDAALGSAPEGVTPLADFLSGHAPGEIAFERFPFDQPLYIVYSSGTTGKPKCIVHRAGGVLLQHLKEQRLHVDLRAGDRIFYFTTCGWMMWNWLVSALASEATLVLYEGSPFEPGPESLWRVACETGVDVFGTSAKYLDAVSKAGYRPGERHDLSKVRTLLSTGSPLLPESFDFVYEHVKGDLHLASISGGTDLLSCFVLGVPTEPVHRGAIQGPGLGMAVEVFDDTGARTTNAPGELVCTRPFPSMPLGFWNDAGDARYRAAYFERYPGVWCHGDWIEERPGIGYVISGRSDAVLNPGGVRIGTAEIYRPVEALDEIVEGLVIGQQWEGDVRVVLFVKLREGTALDDALEKKIRDAVRAFATPRHVPARIVAVPDIPRTRSGKITELAVRDLVHGRPPKNVEALANPEALEYFRDVPALAR